jgi:hypothetical protein
MQYFVTDPHIHVDVNLSRDMAARKMLASTFGLVADLPARVTTGCGEQVPRAMTSTIPRSVTCLACREHAARWHTRAADEAEEMRRMNESMVVPVQLEPFTSAVAEHRALARRFSEK